MEGARLGTARPRQSVPVEVALVAGKVLEGRQLEPHSNGDKTVTSKADMLVALLGADYQSQKAERSTALMRSNRRDLINAVEQLR